MRRAVGRVVCVCALLCAVPALAAVDAFMTFDGSAGPVHVTGVTHPAAAMGMSTGRRMHGEIVITKEVDKASPMFAAAMSSHQPLRQMTITFQGSGAGKSAQKIVLTNATIAGVRTTGKTESITIDYESTEVTWTDGGKTSTDDWEVPK